MSKKVLGEMPSRSFGLFYLESATQQDLGEFSLFIEEIEKGPVVSYRRSEELFGIHHFKKIGELCKKIEHTGYYIMEDDEERYYYLGYKKTRDIIHNTLIRKIDALQAIVLKLLTDFPHIFDSHNTLKTVDFSSLSIGGIPYSEHNFVLEVGYRVSETLGSDTEKQSPTPRARGTVSGDESDGPNDSDILEFIDDRTQKIYNLFILHQGEVFSRDSIAQKTQLELRDISSGNFTAINARLKPQGIKIRSLGREKGFQGNYVLCRDEDFERIKENFIAGLNAIDMGGDISNIDELIQKYSGKILDFGEFTSFFGELGMSVEDDSEGFRIFKIGDDSSSIYDYLRKEDLDRFDFRKISDTEYIVEHKGHFDNVIKKLLLERYSGRDRDIGDLQGVFLLAGMDKHALELCENEFNEGKIILLFGDHTKRDDENHIGFVKVGEGKIRVDMIEKLRNIDIQTEDKKDIKTDGITIPENIAEVQPPGTKLRLLYEANKDIPISSTVILRFTGLNGEKLTKAHSNLNQKRFKSTGFRVQSVSRNPSVFIYCSNEDFDELKSRFFDTERKDEKEKIPDETGENSSGKTTHGTPEVLISQFNLFQEGTAPYELYKFFFERAGQEMTLNDAIQSGVSLSNGTVTIQAINKKLEDNNTGQRIEKVRRGVYKFIETDKQVIETGDDTLASGEDKEQPNNYIQGNYFSVDEKILSGLCSQNRKWFNFEKQTIKGIKFDTVDKFIFCVLASREQGFYPIKYLKNAEISIEDTSFMIMKAQILNAFSHNFFDIEEQGGSYFLKQKEKQEGLKSDALLTYLKANSGRKIPKRELFRAIGCIDDWSLIATRNKIPDNFADRIIQIGSKDDFWGYFYGTDKEYEQVKLDEENRSNNFTITNTGIVLLINHSQGEISNIGGKNPDLDINGREQEINGIKLGEEGFAFILLLLEKRGEKISLKEISDFFGIESGDMKMKLLTLKGSINNALGKGNNLIHIQIDNNNFYINGLHSSDEKEIIIGEVKFSYSEEFKYFEINGERMQELGYEKIFQYLLSILRAKYNTINFSPSWHSEFIRTINKILLNKNTRLHISASTAKGKAVLKHNSQIDTGEGSEGNNGKDKIEKGMFEKNILDLGHNFDIPYESFGIQKDGFILDFGKTNIGEGRVAFTDIEYIVYSYFLYNIGNKKNAAQIFGDLCIFDTNQSIREFTDFIQTLKKSISQKLTGAGVMGNFFIEWRDESFMIPSKLERIIKGNVVFMWNKITGEIKYGEEGFNLNDTDLKGEPRSLIERLLNSSKDSVILKVKGKNKNTNDRRNEIDAIFKKLNLPFGGIKVDGRDIEFGITKRR